MMTTIRLTSLLASSSYSCIRSVDTCTAYERIYVTYLALPLAETVVIDTELVRRSTGIHLLEPAVGTKVTGLVVRHMMRMTRAQRIHIPSVFCWAWPHFTLGASFTHFLFLDDQAGAVVE
jgi:hypothetical protein